MEYNNKDVLLYSKEQLAIIANKLLEEKENNKGKNCFNYQDIDERIKYCYWREIELVSENDFCNDFLLKEELR